MQCLKGLGRGSSEQAATRRLALCSDPQGELFVSLLTHFPASHLLSAANYLLSAVAAPWIPGLPGSPSFYQTRMMCDVVSFMCPLHGSQDPQIQFLLCASVGLLPDKAGVSGVDSSGAEVLAPDRHCPGCWG